MRPIQQTLTLVLFTLLAAFAANPSFAAQPKPELVATPMEELPNIYNFRLQSTYSTYLTRYSGVAVTPHVIATVAHGLFDDEELVWTSSVQRTVAKNTSDYSYNLGRSNIYNLQQKIWTTYASRVAKDKSDQGTSSILTFNADFGAVYSESPLASHYAPTDITSATPHKFMTNGRSKKLMGFPLTDAIPFSSQGYLHEVDLGTRKFEVVTDGNDKDGMTYMVYVMDGPDSYGGNSGGPVFVKDDAGNWQACAIFLGGSGAIYVRAIDKNAHDLITLADQAAGGAGAGETKPEIFAQPDDFNYAKGTNLSINISASISPSTTISWYKDGTPLPGKNSLVLTLDSNSAVTPGDYWMTATNAKGSATTEHITIAPYPPPTFTSQPGDTYFQTGYEGYLSIAYESDLSTAIQWFKNGQAIPNATRYYYAIDSENEYAGTYTITLTSSSGSTTSTPFQVGTYQYDSFDPSRPIENGATDTLKLPITSPPEVIYRWTTPRGTFDTATAELTIESIAESDFAEYKLQLVAPDGNTFKTFDFSARANLPTVIHDTPQATYSPNPFDTYKLQANISGDYTPYQIQWYHDGVAIDGATGLQHTIYPFQENNNGDYHFTLVDRLGTTFQTNPFSVQMDQSGTPPDRYQYHSLYRFLPSSGHVPENSELLTSNSYFNSILAQDRWLFLQRYSATDSYLTTEGQAPNYYFYESNLEDIAGCSWGFALLQINGTVKVYTDFQLAATETLSPNTVDFAMNELGPIGLQSDGTIHLLDLYRPSGDTPESHPDWQRIIRIEAEGDKLLALRSDHTLLLWNFTTAQSTTLSSGRAIRDFDIAAENIPVLLEDDTILQLGHQHTLDGSPANEPAPDLREKSPLSVHATANFTFARLRSNKVHVWGKAPPLQPAGQPLTFGNATYLANAVFTSRHAFSLIHSDPTTQASFYPSYITAETGDFFVARLSGPAGKVRNLKWEKNGHKIPSPSHGAIFSESASADDLANYSILPRDSNFAIPDNTLEIRVGQQASIYYTPPTFTTTIGTSLQLPFGINLAKNLTATIQWYKNGEPFSPDYATNHFMRVNDPAESDSGTYHFTLTTPDGANLQSDPIEVIVKPSLSYTDWTLQHGLETPDDQGLADPDDDTIINYLEYLFDTNPLQHGPIPIEYTYEGTFPIARFSLPYRDTDFTYELEILNPVGIYPWQTDIYRYANHFGPNTIDFEIPTETEDDKTILFRVNIREN